MYRSTITLAAIFAAAVAGSAGAADLPVKAKPIKAAGTPYFLVNENSLSYHYEFTATNPGAGKTPKHVDSSRTSTCGPTARTSSTSIG